MNDLVKFDYSGLDATTRKRVQRNTEDIRAIGKKMAEGFIQLGQKFSDTRDALRHKDGGFQAWFTHEGFDKTFVYKCMTIAENFSSVANSQHLNAGFEALYQLSLPGIPDAARDEAVQRSVAGEKITIEAAKGIAEAHKDWRDKLNLEDWYPLNRKLKIVVNDPFPTGNALHRKYPWGQSKTTFQKTWGNDIRQSTEFADFKLVEPDSRVTPTPKIQYGGEQSEEAQSAADWIAAQYFKRNPNWAKYRNVLIIEDPIDLKKRLSDTSDPDHITWGTLHHSGWNDKGVSYERISGGSRWKSGGDKPAPEPTAVPWQADKFYPVDDRRKFVYDHPLNEDEAAAICMRWYPLCEALSGSAMMSRQKLEEIGWTVQPARGEQEVEEGSPETGEQPEEPAEAPFKLIPPINVLPDKWYICFMYSRDILPDHRIEAGPFETQRDGIRYRDQHEAQKPKTNSQVILGSKFFEDREWALSQQQDNEQSATDEVPEKFAVILIDPPWEYTTYSEDTGQGRSAEAHYPTMSAGDIASLPVGDLAADDCALFMWATWPTIQQAFAVGTAWGFEYKTCAFTWAKVKKGLAPDTHLRLNDDSNWHMGMGFWTRANSEVCLLFVKGSPKRQNADVRQLIVASVRKHSQKPDEQYERIERLVKGPYLELFAREKREGWFAWGNEVEPDISFGGIQAAR
jgi:N6-adenosine-specific RNA methylase IME4